MFWILAVFVILWYGNLNSDGMVNTSISCPASLKSKSGLVVCDNFVMFISFGSQLVTGKKGILLWNVSGRTTVCVYNSVDWKPDSVGMANTSFIASSPLKYRICFGYRLTVCWFGVVVTVLVAPTSNAVIISALSPSPSMGTVNKNSSYSLGLEFVSFFSLHDLSLCWCMFCFTLDSWVISLHVVGAIPWNGDTSNDLVSLMSWQRDAFSSPA